MREPLFPPNHTETPCTPNHFCGPELDCDGYTFWFEQGYSATFRFCPATEVGENEHPYRYEFVLHDPNNERILGYDNAHPVNWKTGMFKHRSEFPDHFHRTKSD